MNKIKHLVISGGGPTGYKFVGALKHLEEKGFYSISNIESIYSTSIGSIIGAIICLKYDWETVINYMVNRPWKDAFPLTTKQIMDAYSNKGLYDRKIADIIFKPLLEAKDLSLNTTLKDLYEYSKIDLHIYTVEVNSFTLVDLSHKTHPDLLVTNAVLMSSTVPTLLAPICDDKCCYIDGGLICNYPIDNCLLECKPENVLGIRGLWSNKQSDTVINNNSNMLEFGTGVFMNAVNYLISYKHTVEIPYEVKCEAEHMSLATIKEIVDNQSIRQQFIEDGAKYAQKMLDNIKERQDDIKEKQDDIKEKQSPDVNNTLFKEQYSQTEP